MRQLTLPSDDQEARRYIRLAVKAYPELYFARLVVLAEGVSEQLVIPRVAESMGIQLDPSFVPVVPLAGRHVDHLWTLLNDLKIPYPTIWLAQRMSLIAAFEARHPGLRVQLVMSDRFLDLSKGEADIAIRGLSRQVDDETLAGRKIAEGDWAMYASRSYVERRGRRNGREDLAHHSVVRFEGAMENHFAARWLRAVASHATVSARSETFPAWFWR